MNRQTLRGLAFGEETKPQSGSPSRRDMEAKDEVGAERLPCGKRAEE